MGNLEFSDPKYKRIKHVDEVTNLQHEGKINISTLSQTDCAVRSLLFAESPSM